MTENEEDIGELAGLFETEHSKAFQNLRNLIKVTQSQIEAEEEFKDERQLWINSLLRKS